jgi:hypothetical protein
LSLGEIAGLQVLAQLLKLLLEIVSVGFSGEEIRDLKKSV